MQQRFLRFHLVLATSGLLMATAVALPAQAAVYRCGSVYQDQPCPEGQTQRELNVPPPPSAQERAATRQQTEALARQAQHLRQEREQRERGELHATGGKPVALSTTTAANAEDNMLTDCSRKPTAERKWSERKREYCASVRPPKKRQVVRTVTTTP